MASVAAMETVADTCPAVHQNGTAQREPHEARPTVCVLRIHLYPGGQGATDSSFLSYPPGNYVAEELCIDAAKACGEYRSCAGPFMFVFALAFFFTHLT